MGRRARVPGAWLHAEVFGTCTDLATLSLPPPLSSVERQFATVSGWHVNYFQHFGYQFTMCAYPSYPKFYNPALAKPEKEEPAEGVDAAGEALLVQVRAVRHGFSRVAPPEAPEMPSGPYEKKGQKSGGVIALMDMLVRELEASLAESQHEEKAAQTDYTELMADSQATRAADLKSVTDKEAAKAGLQSKLTDLTEAKHLTMEELENINAYVSELHGSCDFILENFKLRQDARGNEIESLKNAKAVLAGASYA